METALLLQKENAYLLRDNVTCNIQNLRNVTMSHATFKTKPL